MIYTVHFITNDNSQFEANSYANAVVQAKSKKQAITMASQRPHFGEAFLVMARQHSTGDHARNAMMKAYGHHKGIATVEGLPYGSL